MPGWLTGILAASKMGLASAFSYACCAHHCIVAESIATPRVNNAGRTLEKQVRR